MPYRLIVVALLLFGLVSCAVARDPQLELPDFDHLRSKATESIDISLGSFTFFVARRFVDDDDPDSAAVKDILKGVRGMRIRHFEFDADFAYAKSDVDAVRAQLAARGWNTLAHVRNNRKHEDVDICIAMEKDKITGFAIVASEPREFTIINVVGSLDPQKVAALRSKFADRYGDSLRNTLETGDPEDADTDDTDESAAQL